MWGGRGGGRGGRGACGGGGGGGGWVGGWVGGGFLFLLFWGTPKDMDLRNAYMYSLPRHLTV